MKPSLTMFVAFALLLTACGRQQETFGTQAQPDGGSAQNSNVASLVVPAPSTASYVAKVKNLLTGLPVSDAEVAQVTLDPDSLSDLVSTWMATPQYQAKMQTFFGTAFQQTDVDATALGDIPIAPSDSFFTTQFTSNIHASFPLTVQQIVAQGQPFTQVLTTPSYMMTLPMMMLYAFVDAEHSGDTGGGTNDLIAANPNLTVTFQSASVPSTSSANPTDPNYMVWTFPAVPNVTYNSNATVCTLDPIVLDKTNDIGRGVGFIPAQLFGALLGMAPNTNLHSNPNISCSIKTGWASPYVATADWSAWRMVTIRAPNPGEATTKFYEVDKLRSATELVLNNPRVGFFDTYAFQSLWQTNVSNEFRVTMNQTMIVALGQTFDGTDQTKPLSMAALDSNHAAPGTACYSCHMTMDPMRQFFRQNYTYNFAQQQNAKVVAMPGMFAWDGVSVQGNGLSYLASQLANSPRFATSWTQKLCTYARSGPCSPADPEFVRIAADFTRSDYDFNTLAREMFSSPLITFAAPTQTEAVSGQVYPVNKKVHLCGLLSNRLGITDICALLPQTAEPSALKVAQVVSTILPSDGYSRGSATPTQANDPSLFYFAGLENVCKAVATYVVDNGTTSIYQSSSAPAAIADIVHNLMGIDASRDSQPLQLLQNHYQNARTGGATATNALRSTFVLGCLSPSVVGSGL